MKFTWFFDLDDTLHRASGHVFPHLNRSMTEYIMRHLAMEEQAASELRQRYWRTYGATLLGLMRNHAIDPHHFLWHTHQFPDLARLVSAESGLRHSLRRIPGRKVLFSNSPAHYAEAVLDVLGLADMFDAVYAIEHTGFRPKPMVGGFRALLKQEAVQASRCVMVEDSLPNLVTARRLGMKTVWITRDARRAAWVDVKLTSVRDIPRSLGRLS